MDIFEYFNSRDIAEYCQKIEHQLTAIEKAYMIWRSNHHTLGEKHLAWQMIIKTMPDEKFSSERLGDHTLHSFLKDYMSLQNEYCQAFASASKSYIYEASVKEYFDNEYVSEGIYFDNYDACFGGIKKIIDEDSQGSVEKIRISKQRLYSSVPSNDEIEENESVILDRNLQIVDIENATYHMDDERSLLNVSNGFYAMRVAIPTPFQKGDIVVDVESNRPFLLENIPYWNQTTNANNSVNHSMDWSDMDAGVWDHDQNGEIYWTHSFGDYLNMEYFRGDLEGTERVLLVASQFLKGKISLEEFLGRRTAIIMENYALEMRKQYGKP